MSVEHKIRWFVKAGDEFIPREASMRGRWDFEAKCSCGWETHTGGAVRSYIQSRVDDHKFDVEHGFWDDDEKRETYR